MLTRLIDEYARGTDQVTGSRPATEPEAAPESGSARQGWARQGWTQQGWARQGWTGRVRPPVRTLPSRPEPA